MPQVLKLTRLLALVLLFAWSAAPASGGSSTDDAQVLATRFVEAWNAHDAAAFGILMATDADWVTASGVRLRGREKIAAYLAEEHATWAKHTSMRAVNVSVRGLGEKAAIVLLEWEIATPGKEGSAPSIARGNNQFVAAHEGHWIIVSGLVARARIP